MILSDDDDIKLEMNLGLKQKAEPVTAETSGNVSQNFAVNIEINEYDQVKEIQIELENELYSGVDKLKSCFKEPI